MAPPQERRSCTRRFGVPQGTPLLFVEALSPENLRASTSDSFEAKCFARRSLGCGGNKSVTRKTACVTAVTLVTWRDRPKIGPKEYKP